MSIEQRALEYVENGATLGLGTGRAATAFVRALGARVKQGLSVRGVPTSEATASLARELGIPLLELADAGELDVTFDGADEVDPRLNLIKGYGGALVREKIVAASSKFFVVLVGDEKIVSVLGEHGRVPVEVIPFGEALCRRRLAKLGLEVDLRHRENGEIWITDNGNRILDCRVSSIADPAALDRDLLQIPGVVGTGIFPGMADVVLVQRGDGVEVLKK